MTYSVSLRTWLGKGLIVMGGAHIAMSDWRQLRTMASQGWWATARDTASGEALWFTVAGGALVTIGSLVTERGLPSGRVPRAAALSFILTMGAAFTATCSPGAGLGLLAGAAMCAAAFRSGPA